MNGKDLYLALGEIDERYLDKADTAMKETTMKHFSIRKTLTAALAACLCVCLLTATAMAAGWIPNIFSDAPGMPQNIIDGAVQTNQTAGPDWSKLTVSEQFYDGKELALGFTWDKVTPAPRVNVEMTGEQIAKATQIPGNYFESYTDAPEGVETLDYLTEIGHFTEEEKQETLNLRSDNAKKHNLQNWSALLLDNHLQETLSPADYAAFWQQLEQTGSACAVSYTISLGDHILANGIDAGKHIYLDTTPNGTALRMSPLPGQVQDADSINMELKLKSTAVYYYMELDGHAYDLYETNDEYLASITVSK